MTVTQDNNSRLDVMGQDLIDDDFCESGVNVDVLLRNINIRKSNKCNQCDFTSSNAGHSQRWSVIKECMVGVVVS